jgi:hypothetical protein
MPFDHQPKPLKGIFPSTERIITVTDIAVKFRQTIGGHLQRNPIKISREYFERVHIVYPVHVNPYCPAKAHGILGNQENVTSAASAGFSGYGSNYERSKIHSDRLRRITGRSPRTGYSCLWYFAM